MDLRGDSSLALAQDTCRVSGGGQGGEARIFDIQAASVVVVMTGFRITGGNTFGKGDGGAIRNIGNLTLNNMVVQANFATINSSGGGIYTGAGNRLTINGGSILGNSAISDGGGIFGDSGSIINLTNVTISGNTAAVFVLLAIVLEIASRKYVIDELSIITQ